MGLFDRVTNAWDAFWMGDADGYVPVAGVSAGSPVGPNHADERWMGIAAYFACIRNISEDIAKLPLVTYKRLPRGKDRAKDHKYYNLLHDAPHPAIGSMALRETLTRFALGWGNGFARIHRLTNGDAYAIEPIHPQRVSIAPAPESRIQYTIASKPGEHGAVVPQENMLHIHGLGPDGVRGQSVAGFARETMEFAGSAQTYGKNLFCRGGRPGGILTHPGALKKDQKDKLKESWEQAYGGDNAGRTAVLDHGVEYKPITISPIDAQYLETRQFTIEEIARWFRMPLHKIQYHARAQGWSTLDAMNTDYLTDTLMPWLVRWEEEIRRKLFADDPDHFAEHLVNGLLRADQRGRSEFYVKQFSIGALSINEIRAMENMNPIDEDGGDRHFVPLNMTPAEFANKVSGGKSNDA